jgi:hypothetical protein
LLFQGCDASFRIPFLGSDEDGDIGVSPNLGETFSAEHHRAGERMPIPDSRTLFLPVLRVFADDAGHSIEEIRQHMRVEFKVASDELLHKYPTGRPIFHVNVALALANLQGAPHGNPKYIEKVRRNLYRITENGKSYLKQNS